MKSLLILITCQVLIKLTSTYQLSTNMLLNGNFTQPLFTLYQTVNTYSHTIPGWTCSVYCEIHFCRKQIAVLNAYGQLYSICQNYALDLDSQGINEVVEQKIDLTAGKYLLAFNFGYPRRDANKKLLLIFFNNQLQFYFTPNYQTNFIQSYQEIIVQVVQGTNSIKMTMAGPLDWHGFLMTNISLCRINDSKSQNLISSPFHNPIIQLMNSLPGSRVLLSSLMSFFFNLDRFQFYIYHRRNYTYYSKLFLNLVSQFQNEKALLYRKIFQKFSIINSTVTSFGAWLNSLDYKQKRTDQRFLNIDATGEGFMANSSEFFINSLISNLIIGFAACILFLLFKKFKASKIIKKFSISGFILLLIFSGNIEYLTFFVFREFECFFSTDFVHKIVNLFIVLFFFLVIFVSISLLFWCKPIYKKLIKYMTAEYQSNMNGIIAKTVDQGIVCLLFGATHGILLNFPKIQLFTLLIFEVSWLCCKSFAISLHSYKFKFRQFIFVLTNCLRILFLISLIVHDYSKQLSYILNEEIDLGIIVAFVIFWWMEILLQFLLTFEEIYKSYVKLKYKYLDNKQMQMILAVKQACKRRRKYWKKKPFVNCYIQKQTLSI